MYATPPSTLVVSANPQVIQINQRTQVIILANDSITHAPIDGQVYIIYPPAPFPYQFHGETIPIGKTNTLFTWPVNAGLPITIESPFGSTTKVYPHVAVFAAGYNPVIVKNIILQP